MENDIFKLIKREDYYWLPIHRSLALGILIPLFNKLSFYKKIIKRRIKKM